FLMRTLRLCAFARNSPTRSEFSQRRKVSEDFSLNTQMQTAVTVVPGFIVLARLTGMRENNLMLSEKDEKVDLMPDVIKPRHGFHHAVDWALLILWSRGVGTDRITIRKAGRGWGRARVIEQQPAAGAPLTREMVVELTVEGDGMFHHLPVGMREASR